MWNEWNYCHYLEWFAGEIGDEEHEEPEFDENGQPVIEEGR